MVSLGVDIGGTGCKSIAFCADRVPAKPNPAHQSIYNDWYNSFKALRQLYMNHKEYFEMR